MFFHFFLNWKHVCISSPCKKGIMLVFKFQQSWVPFSTAAGQRNQSGSGGDWGNQSCWKFGVQQWRTELPARHSHTGPYWRIWVCVWGGGQGNGRLYWDLWHWHCCPLVWRPHLSLVFLIILLITATPLSFVPRFEAHRNHLCSTRTPTSTLSSSLTVFPVPLMLKAALSPTRSHLSLLRRPAVYAKLSLSAAARPLCLPPRPSARTTIAGGPANNRSRVRACETVWCRNE